MTARADAVGHLSAELELLLKSTRMACERTIMVKEEAGDCLGTDGAIPDTGGSCQHGDPSAVLCCWVIVLFG